MNWIVKVEKDSKQRITVFYLPLEDKLLYQGECKVNTEWYVVYNEKYDVNTDENIISMNIVDVFEKMQDKIKIFTELNKLFTSKIRYIDFGDDKPIDNNTEVKYI